jgi:hypothetical protein
MKTEPTSAPAPRRALRQALAYLLWLVSVAACVAAVLQLRSAVNALWAALGGNRYSLGLANQVSLLLAGFAAFVYVIFLEGYYREAARRGTSLLRRFGVTMAVPVGVILLSLVGVEVALRAMGQ